MIFSTGPTPDPKLIEDRPDGVSTEAAVGSWLAGYHDARADRDYHTFPEDAFDLQRFYSDGFERGERDGLHMERINGRLPKDAEASDEVQDAGRARRTVPEAAAALARKTTPHLKTALNVGWLVFILLLVLLLARINWGL